MSFYCEPVQNAAEVTPHNMQDLPATSHGIYVGAEGDLSVEMLNGQHVVFSGVPSGSILPIRVKRVRATGTTAGMILALW